MSTPLDPRRYVQLARIVRDQIEDGNLEQGDQLTSITTICSEQVISRKTVSTAYRLLESEGLVKRIPGLGYFVL